MRYWLFKKIIDTSFFYTFRHNAFLMVWNIIKQSIYKISDSVANLPMPMANLKVHDISQKHGYYCHSFLFISSIYKDLQKRYTPPLPDISKALRMGSDIFISKTVLCISSAANITTILLAEKWPQKKKSTRIYNCKNSCFFGTPCGNRTHN